MINRNRRVKTTCATNLKVKGMAVGCESAIYFDELLLIGVFRCLYRLSSTDFKGISV